MIEVMIASPSDVAQERAIIREVLHECNLNNSHHRSTFLMPVGWESHSNPDIGERTQELISKQGLERADLLIAVFWTRVGSPTGRAVSGTVEEIHEHIGAGKPAMINFRGGRSTQTSWIWHNWLQFANSRSRSNRIGFTTCMAATTNSGEISHTIWH